MREIVAYLYEDVDGKKIGLLKIPKKGDIIRVHTYGIKTNENEVRKLIKKRLEYELEIGDQLKKKFLPLFILAGIAAGITYFIRITYLYELIPSIKDCVKYGSVGGGIGGMIYFLLDLYASGKAKKALKELENGNIKIEIYEPMENSYQIIL